LPAFEHPDAPDSKHRGVHLIGGQTLPGELCFPLDCGLDVFGEFLEAMAEVSVEAIRKSTDIHNRVGTREY